MELQPSGVNCHSVRVSVANASIPSTASLVSTEVLRRCLRLEAAVMVVDDLRGETSVDERPAHNLYIHGGTAPAI